MNAIATLADCLGSYRLKAECDACGHGHIFDLDALIETHGADYPLAEIRRRVKCRECGAMIPMVRVQTMSDGRPG